MASKYLNGERITSLDDLAKSDFAIINGNVQHNGWFMSMQIRYLLDAIGRGLVYKAIKNIQEPVKMKMFDVTNTNYTDVPIIDDYQMDHQTFDSYLVIPEPNCRTGKWSRLSIIGCNGSDVMCRFGRNTEVIDISKTTVILFSRN